ncbi:MAG TPA: sialidase family protein [Bacteroidales bacterium]|nr:sialidase family protein [Bacteroidales bacterium]HSA42821.1 sialidase family protein [Bacteroidales bacterium]
MKKLLLITGLMACTYVVYSQQGTARFKTSKQHLVAKKPVRAAVKNQTNMLLGKPGSGQIVPLAPVENNIGETRYDLQTNQSTQNRIYMYPDRTMGGVWTRGLVEASFTERGTGYNYYDGSVWGPSPAQRIEPLRTGWPSYFPFGPEGEMVISHTDVAGLSIDWRTNRGSGNWDHAILAGPPGAVDISWPRAVTTGATHNTIHIIACTYVPYQGQDQALLYYRSPDGGTSWDKQHVILPGMTASDYLSIGGDAYAFADPRGDTLAFVVGDNWIDLFLMKSTDGGNNWTKTVIFQHPYPLFDEPSTLVLDTPTVSDGSLAIFLDHQGKAHVFFGLMRVLNTDLTDQQTSYFPYTDGLAYWKEGMPTMTNISYDTLDANNQIVGYTQDINGNDTILEFDDLGTYYLSVTSMPNATIDEEGKIFLFMTSVVEGKSNGSQNYRHIYTRLSEDNGETWGPFIDINSSLTHNFHECVFPSVSPRTDQNVHVLYQLDEEPGLSVRGDSDPYGDNTILHVALPKSDYGLGTHELSPSGFTVSNPIPNPVRHAASILVELDRPASLTATLTDVTGRIIQEHSYGTQTPGKHSIDIDCSRLSRGLYLLTFTVEGEKQSTRLLVQ